jgi:hypothetical protein
VTPGHVLFAAPQIAAPLTNAWSAMIDIIIRKVVDEPR